MEESLIIGLADTCTDGEVNMGRNYVDAVRRGGHIAVILPYSDDDNICRSMLDRIDVLLLTGGGDLAAWRFGQEPSEFDSSENVDRDSFELRLIDLACRMNKPIAGICRGMQVINVALGGTLWQDMSYKRQRDNDSIQSSLHSFIDHQRPDKKWEGVHLVNIDKDSRLFDVLKHETIMVNSTHHQAVRDLGKDLKVVALSEDLVVEAFESTKLPISAVQWHPERLVCEPFDSLFKNIKKWTGDI